MRPFNLGEYLKDPSKRVITRDGREVRIICTDKLDEWYPICALIKDGGEEQCITFTIDGKLLEDSNEKEDLFFASEKKEGWINIYKNNLVHGIYSTEKEALQKIPAGWPYITTVKIEWEE